MFDPLIRKLGHSADLTTADYDRLFWRARTRRVEAQQSIIEQGSHPEDVQLVLKGYA